MLPLDAAHRAISSVLTVRLLRNALSMISRISFCQVASTPDKMRVRTKPIKLQWAGLRATRSTQNALTDAVC